MSTIFAKRRRPCRWRRCPWMVFPLWVNCTADPIESGMLMAALQVEVAQYVDAYQEARDASDHYIRPTFGWE